MEISDIKITRVLNHVIGAEKMWWYWSSGEGVRCFFGEENIIEIAPFDLFEIYFSMDWLTV